MAVGADHLLLDMVRRRLRQPAGWVAVALHLSRLAPPAPRPHHRRIARVLMEDAARRHEGHVFALGNGDLLLLSRVGDERRPAASLRVASPQALPEVLARLMRADVPDPRDLVSLWPLDSAGDRLLAYALDRVASAVAPPASPAELRSPPSTLDVIANAMNGPDVADLLQRQTAVLIGEAGVRPLFREIRFALSSLESRLALPVRTDSDPFLFRHLAVQLDRRLLSLVELALGTGDAMDPATKGVPPMHLNMTLEGLRSDAFARLAGALRARGLPLGVEISLLEACADPDGFEAARVALRRLDITLVLDGVSQSTLLLARVASLRPDLVKLGWSPRMADPDRKGDGQEELIRDMGPERVLLHHAETEAALRWGLERGIRRFQGRHVDAMLAALRLSGCAHASGCTLQQCIERAAATDAPGRRLCRNHRLLDAGDRIGAEPAPVIAHPASLASAVGAVTRVDA